MSRQTKPDECKMTCSGDVSEKCGGVWRMNIYATGVSGEAKNRLIGIA